MYLYIKNWKEYKKSDNKLKIITPWIIELYFKTDLEYKTYLIEQEFENTIKQITAWYTQAEIDTWATKVEEAEKVIAGGTSDLLSSLLLEWENLLDFAKKILQKAKEYSEIYYKAEKTKREKLKNIT